MELRRRRQEFRRVEKIPDQAGGGVLRPRAAPSNISTPKTSSTTPQIMLMLTPARYLDDGVSAADHAVANEQHADEREHEADWPANIESHKVSSFCFLVYQKMMFKMTHAMISTVPTMGGR